MERKAKQNPMVTYKGECNECDRVMIAKYRFKSSKALGTVSPFRCRVCRSINWCRKQGPDPDNRR